MTPIEITTEIGARSFGDAIDHTRYALSKQAPSASQVTTSYGMLVLTDQEKEALRVWLTKILERRLAALNSGEVRLCKE